MAAQPSEAAGSAEGEAPSDPAAGHPLLPVLAMAEDAYARLGSEVRDYTCRIIRRERLGGKLGQYEFMRAKIRHAWPPPAQQQKPAAEQQGPAERREPAEQQEPAERQATVEQHASSDSVDAVNANNGDAPSSDAPEAEATGDQPSTAATAFSVYLRFEQPKAVRGREVLFRQGHDAGKMLVRRGGTRLAYVTTYLAPDSRLALQESRYPVTDIGFRRLVARLIDVIREDLQHGECRVRFYRGAKIGDRRCTRVLVEHPVRREHFRYHRAIIFIDQDRQLPLGYASYTWPEEPGGKPVLVEEYLYTDVRLNVGLTDGDFDRDNPDYGFLKRKAVEAAR
ncbi:MAG: DUF1571 domain-containing protein [Planctomycetota bacterium]